MLLVMFLVGCVAPQPTPKPENPDTENPDDENPDEPEKHYNILFETNGGKEIEGLSSLEKGDSVKLPEPVKEGNMFIGWYENEDLTGKAYTNSYTYQSDVTLYASWMPLQYKVYYSSTEVDLTTLNQTYYYGV